MSRALRDYQQEAVDAIRSAWKDGMTRPAIVMATGLGKTDVIAKLLTDCAADGGKVLALAHRGELLDQISDRCRQHAPIPVGRVQAGRNQTRRPITVASAQTLANPRRRAKLLAPGQRYDMIAVDECHHAASPSQLAILADLGAFDGVPTFGVTATMVRGDKRGLGDVWEDVVYVRDTAWAIGQGWLVEPRGLVVVAKHVDLNRAKISRGDYQDGELGEMVAQDVEHIAAAWQEKAGHLQTAAYWPTVESSRAAARAWRDLGVPVGEVYGDTPRGEREEIYRDLQTGRIRAMHGVMVTTEGWDSPPVGCIVMGRPTKLPGLYTQIVGRGLRPALAADWPVLGGRDKDSCLVLDVVGASRTQSLMTVVDLHKTAQVNRDELDELPCDECGGYTERQLIAMDLDPQMVALCECPDEEPAPGGVRDPNGGRRKLVGPAEYEDVELFTASQCRWLWTRQGVRFLPAGERTFFLWPDFPDQLGGEAGDARTTWSVASVVSAPWKHERVEWIEDRDERGQELPMTLARARELAEAAALQLDPTVAKRDAAWRRARRRPSEKMVNLASRYGIADPEQYTMGALSDEISIRFASLRLEQGGYR